MKKVAKKQAGWKQQKAEHDAWLENLKKQTLFNPHSRPKMQRASKPVSLVVKGPSVDPSRKQRQNSVGTTSGGGTLPVARPEIQYKDDPEMLERELIARSRKFNVAPAFNKGGDTLMTDEMMTEMKLGSLRRR